MRTQLERFLVANNFPIVSNVRAKQHLWGWFWKSIGVAGTFSTYTGEANVTLPAAPFSLPFLIAHELAHLYGFAAEDAASFIAVMALSRSALPEHRMSVMLSLLSNAPKELQKSLHPSYGESITQLIYDRYLKSHGVEDGIKNYSAVYTLAMSAMASGILHWDKGKAD